MKKLKLVLLLSLLPLYIFGQSQARIVCYNLLNYPGSSNDPRNGYFKTVIDSINPDLLLVDEITSQSGVDQFLSQVLDSTYSASPFINGPDTDCELFFKHSQFTFVSVTPISTALRNIYQYIVYHNETTDTLILYGLHLKASQGSDNEQKRLAEVNNLRSVTDALPPGTDYIVLGDFNIYYSAEPAFTRLLDTTSTGYFVDPIDAVGYWHSNSSFAEIHSQSTRINNIGGGSGGGLDDRFDMILVSPSIMAEGKIDYINNTLVPYGNDGQHLNANINDPPFIIITQEVADALYYASDHLPVLADFTFANPVSNLDEVNSVHNYKLEQNYPNPFNPVTSIRFQLPKSEKVELKIYDMLGREVVTLYNKTAPAGIINVDFDAANLASGIYIYRLTAGSFISAKKLMLLK